MEMLFEMDWENKEVKLTEKGKKIQENESEEKEKELLENLQGKILKKHYKFKYLSFF